MTGYRIDHFDVLFTYISLKTTKYHSFPVYSSLGAAPHPHFREEYLFETPDSPAVTIRTVFPETWIWELAEVGYLKHNQNIYHHIYLITYI